MANRIAVPDEKKEEFISDYNELGTMDALADKWGIAVRTAAKTLDRFGVERKRGRKPRQDYHPKLGVWSDRAIAKEMGISHQAVARARRTRGIPAVKVEVVVSPSDG